MPTPPIYLDECVDHPLVEALRKRGFTVSAARDEGMIGAVDEAQLSYASLRNWLLVSYDGRDYWRLHRSWRHRGHSHSGIVIVPATPPLERVALRVAMMLEWIATFPDHGSIFVTWGQLQTSLEQGYRLPGYGEAEVRLALGRQP